MGRRWAIGNAPPRPSGEPAGSTPPSDDPRLLMRPPEAPFLKRGRMKYFRGGGARPYFQVCPDLAGTRSGAGVTRDLDIRGSLATGLGKSGRSAAARTFVDFQEAAVCQLWLPPRASVRRSDAVSPVSSAAISPPLSRRPRLN